MGYKCSYNHTPCFGSVEWHHPISGDPSVGLYLCQGHHSVLQGRSYRYPEEVEAKVDLLDLYCDLKALESEVVSQAGYNPDDKDKH